MSSCPDPNNVVFDEFALNTQKLGLLLRLSRLLNSDLPHHPHQIHEQCICVFYPCTNHFNTKLTTAGKINRVQTFCAQFPTYNVIISLFILTTFLKICIQ